MIATSPVAPAGSLRTLQRCGDQHRCLPGAADQIVKLCVAAEYNDRLWEWFESGGFKRLALQRSHCDRYRVLPLHHRDPFDRMLIAQAQVEGFSIVTADPRFKRYDVKVVW
jgi:PIN domain nuclease of toxin-antitoxin system